MCNERKRRIMLRGGKKRKITEPTAHYTERRPILHWIDFITFLLGNAVSQTFWRDCTPSRLILPIRILAWCTLRGKNFAAFPSRAFFHLTIPVYTHYLVIITSLSRTLNTCKSSIENNFLLKYDVFTANTKQNEQTYFDFDNFPR